jgi:hypothetical protein
MAKKKPEPISAIIAARHFGVHRRTIAEWFDRGCPRTSIKAIAQWRAANLRNERQPLDQRDANGQAGDQQGPRPLTLQELRLKADTRKINSDVELRRLRIAEKQKDLVSLSDAQRELSELLIRIKERLLAAPDEFETRFPLEVRAQCKADFQEFTRQLLLEISRWKLGAAEEEEIILAAAEVIKAR